MDVFLPSCSSCGSRFVHGRRAVSAVCLTVSAFGILWASRLTVAGAAQQPATVRLELVTEQGFPIGGEQKWARLFRDLGYANVRIRSARGGENPQVRNDGTSESPRFAVRGVLTARNQLRLPGRSFSATQRTAIKGWFQELAERGATAVGSPKSSYGLTPDELVKLHEDLAKPLVMPTQGVALRKVVEHIQSITGVPIQWDAAAERSLRPRSACLDQLKGISGGTALAAALRPQGLVVVPQPGRQGKTSLRVVSGKDSPQHWPVGWKPSQMPGKLAPRLFRFLPVEINDQPLTDALDAIGPRIEVPLLWDHNNLLRQRIEPKSVKVNFKYKRTFYKKLVDDILRQALLKAELRMDEAGKPLLWITTLRQ